MTQKQIFILDASAGTGKTYSLAKRYLKLLFDSFTTYKKPALKEIIAITFTNKASFEMKQRILEMLKKIVLDKFDKEEKKDILSEINTFQPNELQKYANLIIEEILHNYHFFQIFTIDSFIHKLITAYAFHLGISPNFKVEQNFQQYLEYGLAYLIDRISDDNKIKELFEKFLNTYLFMEKKRSFDPKKDIFKIVKILYESSRNNYFDFKKSSSKSDLNLLSEKFIKIVKELYEKLPKEGINKNFIKAIEKFLTEYKEQSGFFIINLENLSDFFGRDEIPVNKGFEISSEIPLLWQQIRRILNKICVCYSTQVYNDYINVYEHTKYILEKITQKQDIVFLEDLNKKINSVVFDQSDFVPELFIRLATTIKHFLIDEFQDTNVLQWNNLLPIIQEVLSSGGSLFYVGDKKQSIYRFRGGDATLFDRVEEQFRNYNIDRTSLIKNRRSKKEIVEFNNFIFSRENLEKFCDEIIKLDTLRDRILKIYSNTQQEYIKENKGGFVYGELIKDSEDYEDIIKNKLLQLIKDLIGKGINPLDIAILVRKSEEASIVSEWLLEERISVESEKTLNIKENPIIKEIISFLNFLNYPLDNFSFVSFLFGKIFSFVSKLSFEKLQEFVIETSKKREVVFYQEFKEKYIEIWNQYFSYLLEISGFLPTYGVLLKIYEIFDLKSNPEFVKNYAFFEHLLGLAKKAEEKNSSLNYFLEFIESLPEEELHINAKTEKSVRVLTIHKAKGLEFKIVIIPFLKIEIEVGKHKGISSRFLIKETNKGLSLIKTSKKINKFSTEIENLYNEEYTNLLIDELNVLYVALTRAKEQLYFFVQENNRNLSTKLFPWNNGMIKRGEFRILENNNKEELLQKFLLEPPIFKNWRELLVEEKIEKEEIINRKKILQGNIIHRILSYIGNLTNKEVKEEIEIAIKKTKKFYKISFEDENTYKEIIYKLVYCDGIKEIFFLDPQDIVLCEQEVVSDNGEIKRIDRLIIKEKLVIIVDFKLSFRKEIENYKIQLNEYANLIEKIYNKSVKKYVIFLDTLELMEL